MPRISADQFRAMVRDISVPDREIGELLIRSPDDGNRGKLRDITLVPDPAKVAVEPGKENALAIGNGISRSRRQRRFRQAIAVGDKRPVLVSEGRFLVPVPVPDRGRDRPARHRPPDLEHGRGR